MVVGFIEIWNRQIFPWPSLGELVRSTWQCFYRDYSCWPDSHIVICHMPREIVSRWQLILSVFGFTSETSPHTSPASQSLSLVSQSWLALWAIMYRLYGEIYLLKYTSKKSITYSWTIKKITYLNFEISDPKSGIGEPRCSHCNTELSALVLVKT